jgi:SM-20-related protein
MRSESVDIATEANAAVVSGIADAGWAVVRNFLPDGAVLALRDEAMRRDAAGELAPAGVGRGAARATRPEIRGDRILWLDETAPATGERLLWPVLAALSTALNRQLMLGLWNFEGHYALYPPGAGYSRHRDVFRAGAGDRADHDGARAVSCVLYLNEDWCTEDGGALRIHLDAAPPRDVLPEGGTLVAFLSDRFEHEVLPARRPRLALTGWFRRRA